MERARRKKGGREGKREKRMGEGRKGRGKEGKGKGKGKVQAHPHSQP